MAEWVPILDVIEPAQPASPQPFTPEVKVYAEAKTFSAPSAWQIDVERNIRR
ncbi:MAG: hypothetical protein WAN75_46975 [Xanthobacteraceae bacterium]